MELIERLDAVEFRIELSRPGTVGARSCAVDDGSRQSNCQLGFLTPVLVKDFAMNHVLLSVRVQGDATQFTANWDTADAQFAGPSVSSLREFAERTRILPVSHSTIAHEQMQSRVRQLTPHPLFDEFGNAISEWSNSTSGPKVVCLHSEAPAIHEVPWELIPVLFNRSDIVIVRVCSQESDAIEPITAQNALVAGWLDVQLPGIERELQYLPAVFERAGADVEVVTQPKPRLIAEKLAFDQPSLLHVSLPSIVRTQQGAEFVLSRSSNERISERDFAQTLQVAPPQFLLLNTCNGHQVSQTLCEATGASILTWFGSVVDDLAGDFSNRFYRNLFELSSVPLALLTVLNNRANFDRWDLSQIPVLWLPTYGHVTQLVQLEEADTESTSAESETNEGASDESSRREEPEGTAARPADSDFPADRPRSHRRRASKSKETTRSLKDFGVGAAMKKMVSHKLEVEEFLPKNPINPALLKCGHRTIDSLRVRSADDLDNVLVEVDCDTGKSVSSFADTVDLQAGSNPIPVDRACFPNLFELIDGSVGRRQLSFTLTISRNGRLYARETTAVQWMDINEWVDQPSTWPYVPAFVQPQSDGVLEVFDQATSELRSIGKPTDDFKGYLGRNGDGRESRARRMQYVQDQLKAIYQTLRDRLSLRYMTAGSIVWNEETHIGQMVRLADEVIERKRGTCHDLALLLAGCAEHVQLLPVVILISEHTLVGCWMMDDEHKNFWLEHQTHQREIKGLVGNEWVITDAETVHDLARNQKLMVIETTGVANGLTFSEACDEGSRLVDPNVSDQQFHAAIDVGQARRHRVISL